ncbi:MAG TPA: SRPBCC family protein [Rhizomicrobium sp.]
MALEREVKILRTFNAPLKLVWAAWTEPAHIAQWWGPRGFSNPVCEWEARPGGKLHVVMRANDEIAKMIARAHHPMTGEFTEVVPMQRLAFVSTAVDDAGKPLLESLTTVRFAERDGKTEMVLHAQAKGLVAIAEQMLQGMEAGWTQSIDKLEDMLDDEQGTPVFTITRMFAAPRDRVWRAYSELDALSKWWGPAGFTWLHGTLDFRPGGVFHYGMRSPNGQEMWGKFVYSEVVKPERIVFTNSFSDKDGNTVRAPFAEDWPLEVLNVVTIAEMPGRTALMLRGTPYNATEAEKKWFAAMKPSMDQGFKGTLDQLEGFLARG